MSSQMLIHFYFKFNVKYLSLPQIDKITLVDGPSDLELILYTYNSLSRLDWDGIRKHLDEYASIASSSKGGRIGIEEFAEYLKLPVSDVLRQLFALFDRVR